MKKASKIVLVLVIVCMALIAWAALTPSPVAGYVFSGGNWAPLSGGGSGTTLGYTPNPVGLYTWTGSAWQPWAGGGGAPGGAAGGDLSGTYPNPTVAKCNGGTCGTVTSVATTSPITGGTITGTGTIACATCAIGPGASSAGHRVTFLNTDGLTLADGGAVTNGTVTSVTFTGDGTVLSSTPSGAVTASGTVTGSLANAAAGTLLGNSTGSAAAPTYGTFASYGIPRIVYNTSTGSQNATVGPTTVVTPSGNHHYRISGILKQLTAGASGTCNSGGTAAIAWAWTDADTSVAITAALPALISYSGASISNITIPTTGATNSTRASLRTSEIFAKTAVAVTYTITVVQDNCTTHGTYSLDPVVEQLD